MSDLKSCSLCYRTIDDSNLTVEASREYVASGLCGACQNDYFGCLDCKRLSYTMLAQQKQDRSEAKEQARDLTYPGTARGHESLDKTVSNEGTIAQQIVNKPSDSPKERAKNELNRGKKSKYDPEWNADTPYWETMPDPDHSTACSECEDNPGKCSCVGGINNNLGKDLFRRDDHDPRTGENFHPKEMPIGTPEPHCLWCGGDGRCADCEGTGQDPYAEDNEPRDSGKPMYIFNEDHSQCPKCDMPSIMLDEDTGPYCESCSYTAPPGTEGEHPIMGPVRRQKESSRTSDKRIDPNLDEGHAVYRTVQAPDEQTAREKATDQVQGRWPGAQVTRVEKTHKDFWNLQLRAPKPTASLEKSAAKTAADWDGKTREELEDMRQKAEDAEDWQSENGLRYMKKTICNNCHLSGGEEHYDREGIYAGTWHNKCATDSDRHRQNYKHNPGEDEPLDDGEDFRFGSVDEDDSWLTKGHPRCNHRGCLSDDVEEVYDNYNIYAGRYCAEHKNEAPGQWDYAGPDTEPLDEDYPNPHRGFEGRKVAAWITASAINFEVDASIKCADCGSVDDVSVFSNGDNICGRCSATYEI